MLQKIFKFTQIDGS